MNINTQGSLRVASKRLPWDWKRPGIKAWLCQRKRARKSSPHQWHAPGATESDGAELAHGWNISSPYNHRHEDAARAARATQRNAFVWLRGSVDRCGVGQER